MAIKKSAGTRKHSLKSIRASLARQGIPTDKIDLILNDPCAADWQWKIDTSRSISATTMFRGVTIYGIVLGDYRVRVVVKRDGTLYMPKFSGGAYINNGSIHPHIYRGSACFGDAIGNMAYLLNSGCLPEVFDVCGHLLDSYNPHSTYDKIGHLANVTCTCGVCNRVEYMATICDTCQGKICVGCMNLHICNFCRKPIHRCHEAYVLDRCIHVHQACLG